MSIEKARADELTKTRDELIRSFHNQRQLYALVDYIEAKVNAILDARSEISRASAGGGEAIRKCFECGVGFSGSTKCPICNPAPRTACPRSGGWGKGRGDPVCSS